MRLLVVDIVRRASRWWLVFGFVFTAASWRMWPALDAGPRALAVSMGVAFSIGQQILLLYPPRPLWYLPVSRRDIWRAVWIFATVGATATTTSAKLVSLLAPWGGARFGLSSLLLSTVYDFAFSGVGCGVAIVMVQPQPSRRSARAVWPLVQAAAFLLRALGFVAAFNAPLWLPPNVPATRWTDLGARGAVLLGAALAVTCAAYFYTPRPTLSSRRRLRPLRSGAKRPARSGSLTGLPLLLWQESRWTLLMTAAVCVLLFAVAVMTRVMSTHASGGGPALLVPFVYTAMFIVTLSARFPMMLRHLRVLPLGNRTVVSLLVVWPVMVGLTIGAGIGLMRYLITGTVPSSGSIALVVALAGLSAFVQAVTLPKALAGRLVVFGVAFAVAPLAPFMAPASPLTLVLVAGGALAAAVAVNVTMLSRNSMYKPPILPAIQPLRST